MDAPRPLSVSEAQARVLARFRRGGAEPAGLDAAPGRVLAADAVARWDLPAFTQSAMDGYAVRAADTVGATSVAPVRLSVVGMQAAGETVSRGVGAGEAAAITTGAQLPAGADAVVRLEETDGGMGRIAISAPVSTGANIRRQGEVVRAGMTVLPAGTRLGAGQIAVLAATGHAYPAVVRRPRIALLSTGNELVPTGQPAHGAQVPDINGPMLAALIAQTGSVAVPLGIARDTADEIGRLLDTARDVDCIITTGGISIGAYDAVRAAIAALGAVDFWQVRMRPGRPTAFGVCGEIPVLALPGNPVAAFVAFHLLARPAIARMLGKTPEIPGSVPVRLARAIATRGGDQAFLRARIRETPTGREADIATDQGTGNVAGVAFADALVIIPEGTGAVGAGETAEAILIP